ncbi:heavy-metal-associated domain-containing protein [Mucilaginibacter sp.]|uniref:heavy-metal-associated domain-containing protein n=1 Tax=Mucilaginibacter sp. TaxID=1882438 RepID=UPI003565480B
METLKFKTNIKCGGCIATVTPALDNLEGIEKWEVDTANPDKILTVESDNGLNANEVISALKTKGYNAEKI